MNSHELVEKIKELQSAHGSKAKTEVLKKYSEDEDFMKFLRYLLDPMLTYKVSEQALRKAVDSVLPEDLPRYPAYLERSGIFDACEWMAGKSAASKEDLKNLACFLFLYPAEIREVFIGLLSKSLRLGVTNTTVNKVIPGLIHEWSVQQAYPIDKYPLKPGTHFWLTQKLNGVRATYFQGKLYARTGQEYTGLEHIISDIKAVLGDMDLVLDGELTLHPSCRDGMNDNECFRKSTGIINSDDADKTSICYTVFDALPENEFFNGESFLSYRDRRKIFLDPLSKSFFFLYAEDGYENVSILPVLYEGEDQSRIDELLDQMVREDKEGLMVNLDVTYKCRRHNGILKVKRFYTMDLPILKCEEGSGRLSGTLGAFVVDFKGNEVRVGSGFSDEQRASFWKDREEIIGTLCEVKYKEISYDKGTGEESLQFPIFVTLRTDKDAVSYG